MICSFSSSKAVSRSTVACNVDNCSRSASKAALGTICCTCSTLLAAFLHDLTPV